MHEEYWDEFSDASLSNSWSMAKSYISILVGIAIKEGFITSIDDKVGKYLETYNDGKDKNLTIKHLLTMSSGIDFGEHYMNPFGFMAKALYGNDVKDIAYLFETLGCITIKLSKGNIKEIIKKKCNINKIVSIQNISNILRAHFENACGFDTRDSWKSL